MNISLLHEEISIELEMMGTVTQVILNILVVIL
jgi:hypothetical protein